MSLFSLMAKLTLDTSGYDKGIEDSKSKISSLGGAVAKGVSTLAKIGVAGVGAATTAVGVLAKKSVDSYAEYEQMVGGVKKLYGDMGMSLEEFAQSQGKSVEEVRDQWYDLEQAQGTVLYNAKNAFKTTGMSANQYMEIATSFSAALINSLGGDTVEAAKKTDVAMRAISDNWNTFGGDLGMIQGAFQGFAKQNYTMLDNLKLGYGGTASEMARLVKDSGVLGKAADDLTAKNLNQKVSFAQIVDAIQIIQEKQHIAGTTAKEASSTIAGSVGSVKAAWENLVTGFADPKANLGKLMQDFTSTAVTAVGNMIPAFVQALSGIVKAINKILPDAIAKIPSFLQKTAVPLVKTGVQLVSSLIQGISSALPQLFTMAQSLLQQVQETFLPKVGEFLGSIGDKLVTGIPKFLETVLPMIEQFTANLRENAGKFIDIGIDFILKLAQGIINSLPTLIAYIPQIVINIAGIINDNAPKLLLAGIKLIGMLIEGIIKSIPALIANFPKIVQAIFAVITAVNWISLGAHIITFIGNGIKALFNNIPNILKSIGEGAINFFKYLNWQTAGKTVIQAIGTGIKAVGGLIWNMLSGAAKSAITAFGKIDWVTLGKNIIIGIGNGIIDYAYKLVDAAVGAAEDAVEAVKDWLGIASPSKRARDEIGKWMAIGVGAGWEKYMPIDDMKDTMEDTFNDVSQIADTEFVPDEISYAVKTIDTGSNTKDQKSTFSPVFNIYGSEGQDVNELAQIVLDKLTLIYERQGSVFA